MLKNNIEKEQSPRSTHARSLKNTRRQAHPHYYRDQLQPPFYFSFINLKSALTPANSNPISSKSFFSPL